MGVVTYCLPEDIALIVAQVDAVHMLAGILAKDVALLSCCPERSGYDNECDGDDSIHTVFYITNGYYTA